jgi:E3 ubiquitin-protein ligase HECTD4
VELAPCGASLPLSWENRTDYAAGVRQLRLREWEARERTVALRAGLATTAPLGVILHLFSPEDLELRVCGLPHVDLKFLRAHTIYQVSWGFIRKKIPKFHVVNFSYLKLFIHLET